MKWDEMTFALTPTDSMYQSIAKKGEPFAKGKIIPYQPLALYPSATVLNYGQGIFEGIKAFRTSKERIVVFRPQANGVRLNKGAKRFVMSEVPEDVFMHAIDSVIQANGHWVPPLDKFVSYLRIVTCV